MKKIKILLAMLIIPFFGISQDLDEIEFISPFNEGLASIKKGGQWAFINEKGNIVIDFRDDLVPEKVGEECYPIFSNGRCLIQRQENNITYFGFADETGKTVISPKYLKAKSFEHNRSIVLMLLKQNLGYNNLLEKPVVSYKYREVLIDRTGEIKEYLSPLYPFSMLSYSKKCPEIKSRIVSKDLIVVAQNNSFALKKY